MLTFETPGNTPIKFTEPKFLFRLLHCQRHDGRQTTDDFARPATLSAFKRVKRNERSEREVHPTQQLCLWLRKRPFETTHEGPGRQPRLRTPVDARAPADSSNLSPADRASSGGRSGAHEELTRRLSRRSPVARLRQTLEE